MRLHQTDAFLDLAKTLRNWQLLAVLLAVADVVLIGSFVTLALSTRTVPYVVEIDRHGDATYAGPMEVLDTPEERLVVAQLRRFLWDLRSLVDDPAAQAELIARAYTIADGSVRTALDADFAKPENDPRLLAPKVSRRLEAITILRLPNSERTFQLQWKEVTTPRNGIGGEDVRSFQGLLTIDFAKRLDPEALALNPLAILVTDFTWTEIPR